LKLVSLDPEERPHIVSSTSIHFVFCISRGSMDEKVGMSALHGMAPGALLTPTGENFMFT
jgi:hypothetical protein